MEIVAVSGQPRVSVGKKSAGADRKEGKIPCVLYGGDEVVHFTTTINEVKKTIYTPDFKLVNLQVDGKEYKAIVKDVQFNKVTDAVDHIDFLRLVDGHPIKVDLPVRLLGTASGVREGGKLIQQLRKVKVKVLPEKLVDQLSLNVATLGLGQSIRVRDIEAIEGVEVLVKGAIPVATIEIPRALRSAAAAAASGKK